MKLGLKIRDYTTCLIAIHVLTRNFHLDVSTIPLTLLTNKLGLMILQISHLPIQQSMNMGLADFVWEVVKTQFYIKQIRFLRIINSVQKQCMDYFWLNSYFEIEPVKCKDKSFLCARIDKSNDCADDDVQEQCPKSCNACQGTYIYNIYTCHTKGNNESSTLLDMLIRF